MIDFHSHILPGFDDGSKNTQMSLAMIEEERKQGVHAIVATPHFYADEDSVERFLKRRVHSYERLQEEAGKQNIELPKMYLGAEVYYFPGIGQASMISQLCIQKTGILLLEMPFTQWTSDMLDNVRALVNRPNIKVVLAHIERFYDFQKRKEVWDEIMDLPIYRQMNAGPFLNWKKRRKCLKLLKQQGEVLLGSDCHNLDSRKPNLALGRAVIAEKLGQEYLDRTDALEKRLFES